MSKTFSDILLYPDSEKLTPISRVSFSSGISPLSLRPFYDTQVIVKMSSDVSILIDIMTFEVFLFKV